MFENIICNKTAYRIMRLMFYAPGKFFSIKEILENKLDRPAIFDSPLYNKFQFGIGNIPENGLERILEFF